MQIIPTIDGNSQDFLINCFLFVNGFYEKSDINCKWSQKHKGLITKFFHCQVAFAVFLIVIVDGSLEY